MLKNLVIQILSFGLTQTEVAQRSGIAQSRISAVLNNKQKTMDYENGKRLEHLLLELTQSEQADVIEK